MYGKYEYPKTSNGITSQDFCLNDCLSRDRMLNPGVTMKLNITSRTNYNGKVCEEG